MDTLRLLEGIALYSVNIGTSVWWRTRTSGLADIREEFEGWGISSEECGMV